MVQVRRGRVWGVCALLAVLGLCGLRSSASTAEVGVVSGSAVVVPERSLGSVVLAGERAFLEGGVEVVYQSAESRPKGVFAVLHGCSHGATDSWPSGAGCPECVGLPIETRVVGAALERGWAVAAVSSVDRVSRCWGGADLARVEYALGEIRRRTGAGPYTAVIGASSGGGMATAFPRAVGVVAQIMPSHTLDASHPPVRFVHMSRDASRAAFIHKQVKQLRSLGVDADELLVNPSPLSVDSLFRRGPGPGGEVLPTRPMAEAVFDALDSRGFLDADRFLVDDPRRSDWRTVVRPSVPEDVDSLVADESPLSEVLNAHYAQHEFTDAFLDQSLDWLDAKLAGARPEAY